GQNATLEVETRADGAADRLDVTGKATLQGGTVLVLPEDDLSGYRGKTLQYSILEAVSGIDGQFAESVTPSMFLRSSLSYQDEPAGGKTAVLELTGLTFSHAAGSSNEKAIAQILDSLHDQDPTSPL